jgi:hypothetical protein
MAVGAVTAASVTDAASQHYVWKTYTNVRFQYAICYPAQLLVPQGESPNSDGQAFLAKDGARLIVYGQYNATDQSLREILATTVSRLTAPARKLTYKSISSNGFVVSGYTGDKIFYVKTVIDHNAIKSFELTYNAADAGIYRPLIGRLSACFSSLSR